MHKLLIKFKNRDYAFMRVAVTILAFVLHWLTCLDRWQVAFPDDLFVPQSRLRSLEEELQQDRRASLQLELLKKEKAQLMSQLTAHESVIDGLRAERKIWGQELAHQGGRHQEKVYDIS